MTAAVPEPTLEGKIAEVAETLSRDRMAYYGYTPEQIEAAENWPGHDASGCFFENMNWVCTDEDDKPNHPDRDELEQTAEFVMWVLEHPAVVEVRERAVEEAFNAAADELEWVHPEVCPCANPEAC